MRRNFFANRHDFSSFHTDGVLPTDLLKQMPVHAVGEDVVAWISHVTPPFSVFQQSGLAAGRKGRKDSSSILTGSLTRSLAEVIIHPCGYLKCSEPSLNETSRWVGVWGRRGEWEQGEGQTKGMKSSACVKDQICCTLLPFPPPAPTASACKLGREIVCWVGLAGGENGPVWHPGGIAKTGIL